MSAKGDSPSMDHVEDVKAGSDRPHPTFAAKVKAHYRKWWWAHLIFFVAATLIIVLCVIYVAYPRQAQSDINASTLAVNTLVLSNPTPTSFHLHQNSTIGNKSKYHPNLDAFNASLALDGNNPFGNVEFPAIHATETAYSVVDQDVQITDNNAFIAYTSATLAQEEVKVHVKGRTGLHEMRFPTTHVDYNKIATLKGLNSLTGFNVTSFSVKLTPEPDGANMLGTVLIPNPTVMTISMGNVTFNNSLPATASTPKTPIGTTLLNNLTLVPGDNSVPMRSTINQTLVIGAVAKQYKDGMLPVEITGDSSIYDGQHLPYFESALRQLTQKVTLNVGAALKDAGVDASTLAALAGSSSPP